MRRHELSDAQWELIADLMPKAGRHGDRRWQDHWQVVNGLMWKLCTGAQWRDLPEQYGPWQTVYERMTRWRREGMFDRILDRLRFDLREIGDPLAEAEFEAALWAPGRAIREYRFRLNQKRRALIRDALTDIIGAIDADLVALSGGDRGQEGYEKVTSQRWEELRHHADHIEVLLGSSVEKPPRWGDLRRHLHFGLVCDLRDIGAHDWPAVREGLR